MKAGSMRMMVVASAIAVMWLVGVTWGATGTQVSVRASMASGKGSNQQTKRGPALSLFGRGIAYWRGGDKELARRDIAAARALDSKIDAKMAKIHLTVPSDLFSDVQP